MHAHLGEEDGEDSQAHRQKLRAPRARGGGDSGEGTRMVSGRKGEVENESLQVPGRHSYVNPQSAALALDSQ